MKSVIFVFCLAITACDVSTYFAPPAPDSIRWKKDGYTRHMNEIALSECGYGNLMRNEIKGTEYYTQVVARVEQCMLDKGFKFSPSGWKELDPENIFRKDSKCSPNNQSPACKSIAE